MSVPEILIVEDEETVQSLLKKILEEQGYNIHQAYTLLSARNILNRRHIDLICLDINLPDGNGLEFCRRLKHGGEESVKVVILTKKTGVSERITSFNAGADDYVPKPFYPSELLARVKKQLDGYEKVNQRLRLREKSRVIIIDGSEVYLTISEYYFLEGLISVRVETRKELAKYISSKRGRSLSDSSLTVLSTRLRKKIKDETDQEIFTSHYSKGYRLVV